MYKKMYTSIYVCFFISVYIHICIYIYICVFAGFEHFDVVHLADGQFGVAPGEKIDIVEAILELPLHRALRAGCARTFRRCALQSVGIADVVDECDEESSMRDSECDSSVDSSEDSSDTSSTTTDPSEKENDVNMPLEVPAVDVASQSGVSKEDDPQWNHDMPEKPHESNSFVPCQGEAEILFGLQCSMCSRQVRELCTHRGWR